MKAMSTRADHAGELTHGTENAVDRIGPGRRMGLVRGRDKKF